MLICLSLGAASGPGFLSVGGSCEPGLEKHWRHLRPAPTDARLASFVHVTTVARGIVLHDIFLRPVESETKVERQLLLPLDLFLPFSEP